MSRRVPAARHGRSPSSRGAPSAADRAHTSAQLTKDDSGILEEQLYLQARRRPRKLKRVPALLGEALRLVWSTSHVGTANVIAVQFLGAAVAAIQVLLGGYAVGQLVANDGRFEVGAVLPPLLLLAVVTLVGSLGTTGMSQLGRLLGVRVQRRVQARVLDVTTSVELVSFDDPVFYDQLQRVTANVPTQPYTVVSSTASLVGGVVGAASLVVTLIIIQPVLAVLLLLTAAPLWWLSRKGGNLEFTFAMEQAEPYREREYASEVLSRREGAGEVRAYGTAPWLMSRWSTSYDGFIAATRRQIRRRYALNAASALATGLVTIATLIVLVWLVDSGSVSVGAAASSAVAIRLLAGRLQQLFGGLTNLFEASVFLDDFTTFLGRSGDASMIRSAATNRPDDADETRPSAVELGDIRARNVTFRYPNSSTDALRGVSLDLRRGEIVALVGENGSGKTTLAKLLSGLYEPRSGQITWCEDGTDFPLTGPEGERARSRIGVVFQDFTRYQLSAADNISLGRPKQTPIREQVVAAAQHVGADEFIDSLPHGFDTRLSRQFRGGRELSQGQWQRMALARVFYRDADLVILDEPAAALDPRAEQQLFESVRRVLAGRTVLLITHRLNSVRGADRIVVLEHGTVREEGTHESLTNRNGLYAELVRIQAEGTIGSV